MKNLLMRCFALLLVIGIMACLPAYSSFVYELETRCINGNEVQYYGDYAYILEDAQPGCGRAVYTRVYCGLVACILAIREYQRFETKEASIK